MRNRPILLTAILLIVPAAAHSSEPVEANALSFLKGIWIGEENGVRSEEHWTSSDGNALLGMHKDVHNGTMVSFEYLRIGSSADGVLTYFASPGGKTPTPFPIRSSAEHRAVFENLDHDFPQRIIYWLDDQGRLGARIEGAIDGEPRAMEWRWTKQH